ncbi:hypothetical protein ISS07_01775 [Candidatus Woesearchaeota archaeon]|nr:hypothetical protein [Candidatus Woesearchaeota archaeon]
MNELDFFKFGIILLFILSLVPIKKSEFGLIKRIFWFIVGLLNIIPSEINIYEALVAHTKENLVPNSLWYAETNFLIDLFYVLIPLATIYAFYEVIRYGYRYDVFGLRQLVDRIEDYFNTLFGR